MEELEYDDAGSFISRDEHAAAELHTAAGISSVHAGLHSQREVTPLPSIKRMSYRIY